MAIASCVIPRAARMFKLFISTSLEMNGINFLVFFIYAGYSFGNCSAMSLSSASARLMKMAPRSTTRKTKGPPTTTAEPTPATSPPLYIG